MKSLEDYLHPIQQIYQTQKATEHSYRPALQQFIQYLRPFKNMSYLEKSHDSYIN